MAFALRPVGSPGTAVHRRRPNAAEVSGEHRACGCARARGRRSGGAWEIRLPGDRKRFVSGAQIARESADRAPRRSEPHLRIARRRPRSRMRCGRMSRLAHTCGPYATWILSRGLKAYRAMLRVWLLGVLRLEVDGVQVAPPSSRRARLAAAGCWRSSAGRTHVRRLPRAYGPGCWIRTRASMRTAIDGLRSDVMQTSHASRCRGAGGAS
jgi:hypothetical protein